MDAATSASVTGSSVDAPVAYINGVKYVLSPNAGRFIDAFDELGDEKNVSPIWIRYRPVKESDMD